MGVERFFSSLKEGFDIIKTTEHPFQKVDVLRPIPLLRLDLLQNVC